MITVLKLISMTGFISCGMIFAMEGAIKGGSMKNRGSDHA